jgi:hypothetical protein
VDQGWNVLLAGTGLVASALYGCFAIDLFVQSDQRERLRREQAAHQFWLNFLGSGAGWVLAALIANRWQEMELSELLAVGLLALIGVTGHLPLLAVGIAQSSGRLLDWLKHK